MKIAIKIVSLVFLTTWFIGCHKHVPLEQIEAPIESRIIPLDERYPSQEMGDIIILTHIKKMSYGKRTAETPYMFVLNINGLEFTESLKGVEEVESDMDEERGEGIHYVLKKRLRLKPGMYEISLKSEDGKSAKKQIKIVGGRIYLLRFEPNYGPLKFGRPKHFREGIKSYAVYKEIKK